MSKWKVEYDNDVLNGAFWQWWTVSNGTMTFKSDDEDHANWLCDKLN